MVAIVGYTNREPGKGESDGCKCRRKAGTTGPGRRFQSGQSGNPKGKRKGDTVARHCSKRSG
jgi:hypothetical protein